MTTRRSRCVVTFVSSAWAAGPPTRISPVAGRSASRSRRRATVCCAARDSPGSARVAETSTRPSTTRGCGSGADAAPAPPSASVTPGGGPAAASGASVVTSASATPGSSATAASTASASPAGARIWAGAPAPASKCSLSRAWACRASESPSSTSSWATPSARSCSRPPQRARSTTVVATQTRRGRRATTAPTRVHTPWSSSRPATGRPAPSRGGVKARPRAARRSARRRARSGDGIVGQKAARPVSRSSAGSRVRAASHANATPVAATGPRERVELRSEAIRISRARATVEADAVIAPKDPRTAARSASPTSARTSSSSRCRATSRRQ